MRYIVLQVGPSSGEPYWTIGEAETGHAVPNAARFISKQKAQDEADRLNAIDPKPSCDE
jgi:hypothetical protein